MDYFVDGPSLTRKGSTRHPLSPGGLHKVCLSWSKLASARGTRPRSSILHLPERGRVPETRRRRVSTVPGTRSTAILAHTAATHEPVREQISTTVHPRKSENLVSLPKMRVTQGVSRGNLPCLRFNWDWPLGVSGTSLDRVLAVWARVIGISMPCFMCLCSRLAGRHASSTCSVATTSPACAPT